MKFDRRALWGRKRGFIAATGSLGRELQVEAAATSMDGGTAGSAGTGAERRGRDGPPCGGDRGRGRAAKTRAATAAGAGQSKGHDAGADGRQDRRREPRRAGDRHPRRGSRRPEADVDATALNRDGARPARRSAAERRRTVTPARRVKNGGTTEIGAEVLALTTERSGLRAAACARRRSRRKERRKLKIRSWCPLARLLRDWHFRRRRSRRHARPSRTPPLHGDARDLRSRASPRAWCRSRHGRPGDGLWNHHGLGGRARTRSRR